jgi:hypothetical protein
VGGAIVSKAALVQRFQIHRITITASVSNSVLPPTAATTGLSRHRLRAAGA